MSYERISERLDALEAEAGADREALLTHEANINEVINRIGQRILDYSNMVYWLIQQSEETS